MEFSYDLKLKLEKGNMSKTNIPTCYNIISDTNNNIMPQLNILAHSYILILYVNCISYARYTFSPVLITNILFVITFIEKLNIHIYIHIYVC